MDNPFLPPTSNLQSRESFSDTQAVSDRVIDGLRRTKGWVRFFAIISLISFTFQILQLALGAAGILALDEASGAAGVAAIIPSILFGILLTVWPALRLMRYARSIDSLMKTKSMTDLEEAFDAHRGYWKIIGVFTLIVLIIAGVGIAIGILGAIAGR